MRMKVTLRLLAFLAVCPISASAEATTHRFVIRQPATTFTIGPGTVMSVRGLDMPFVGMYYAIQYRSDDGELIELWHSDRNLLLVKGMHGMLTYSTQPERVLQFRVLAPTPKEIPAHPPVTSSSHRDASMK